ncbi:hypothetical protein ACEQ8H_003063 [Pleosporales sp. CAS-2024a]
MASRIVLGALGAISFAQAHMQMSDPSPLRDPHANRPNEPKDYNILQPLHPDGSDFACKGYQWNTPWTTVATYEAGGTYTMSLLGSAMHGGGSCQLSMAFDGGMDFKVIKSIEGGCPEGREYNFTVPPELAKGGKKTGLFAWTWFNKVGNREMYMSCAVVDVVPKGSHSKHGGALAQHIETRGVQHANAAAQEALSSYPPLFVANLKGINNCVTQETDDVIFDTPGNSVQYADEKGSSAKPSFPKGRCVGQGKKGSGSPSPPISPGQWQPSPPSNPGSSISCNDGHYHPSCWGGSASQKSISGSMASASASAKAKPVAQSQDQHEVQDLFTGGDPSPHVQAQLSAYLKLLYNNARLVKRADCADSKTPTGGCTSPGRWMRKGKCTWACERQGTATSIKLRPTPLSQDEIDASLESLGTSITKVMQLVLAKQSTNETTSKGIEKSVSKLNADITKLVQTFVRGGASKSTLADLSTLQSSLKKLVTSITPHNASISKRETVESSHSSSLAVPEPANTLAAFMDYLSKLQTTVIECIRNITAAVTTTSTTLPATITVAVPLPMIPPAAQDTSPSFPSAIDKRQLVVPAVSPSDWLNSLNITSTAASSPIYAALGNLSLAWARLYESLHPTTQPPSSPSTPPPNPLQLAANNAAFHAALVADQQQNTPAPSKTTDPSASATLSPSLLADPAVPFPLFLAPGPVLLSGVSLPTNNAGGGETGGASGNLESFPVVVDDLGAQSEDEVLKFFEDLEKGNGGGGGDGEGV